MGHVMQFQQGVNVMMSALPHQILNSVTFGSYNPYMPVRQDYHNTPNPAGLNVEAQADWYTHDYCVKTGAC
jgi:PAB1-binding protein PBP1